MSIRGLSSIHTRTSYRVINSRQTQTKGVVKYYIKAMETRPLRLLTEHPIALTAFAWNIGNFVRVLVTAYNTNTSGNNSISPDDKFIVISRTSSDAVANMVSYWIPFFSINPITRKLTRKLLGNNVPNRVFNFTSELMALIPTMLIFHGLGAKLSSYLTNFIINHKERFQEYSLTQYLMKLGENNNT